MSHDGHDLRQHDADRNAAGRDAAGCRPAATTIDRLLAGDRTEAAAELAAAATAEDRKFFSSLFHERSNE